MAAGSDTQDCGAALQAGGVTKRYPQAIGQGFAMGEKVDRRRHEHFRNWVSAHASEKPGSVLVRLAVQLGTPVEEIAVFGA